MNIRELSEQGPRRAEPAPAREFKPSFRLVGPDCYELDSAADDAEAAIAELEALGVSVPPGVVPRLVEAKHDPAAWHRDTEFVEHPVTGGMTKAPAVTRGIVRRRWVFDLKALPVREMTALVDHVLRRKRKAAKPPVADTAYVVGLADLQIGKTGPGGGTRELLDHLGDKLDAIVADAKRQRPSEIVLADLGDGCESTENVAQQAHTNDLSFTDQLDLFNALTLRITLDLADIAPVRFVAVPSNHMQLRKNRERVGIAQDDFGILNARTLSRTLQTAGRDDVQVIIPQPHDETLTLDVAGLPVGFTHGHQVSNPDKLPEWWARQAFGDQPLAAARLCLSGHFHHLRVQQVGNGRTWIQAPTMDPGSAWFTYSSGEVSQRGILTLTVAAGQWDHLRIH